MKTPHQEERISETVEKGEKARTLQAPNRAGIWSRSQNPRAKAMSGPRFEQTIMELQVSQNAWARTMWPTGSRIGSLFIQLLRLYSLLQKLPSL